jgi:hypothetical protein
MAPTGNREPSIWPVRRLPSRINPGWTAGRITMASPHADEHHADGRNTPQPDDNLDDNDNNQRHTIPAVGHRSPTLIGRRACAAVDYGSEGWGFESLRLRR